MGARTAAAQQSNAVRWTYETGNQSLERLLSLVGVDVSGIALYSVTGISRDGNVIVGLGQRSSRFGPWRIDLPADTQFPLMRVEPASDMAFAGIQGGPYTPGSITYSVSTSSGTANYVIQGIPDWLTASSTSGTATTTPTIITFSIKPGAALPVGTTSSHIAIQNTDTAMGSRGIDVSVMVDQAQPTLIFSAIAPTARTTTVGVGVTGFATIINAGQNVAAACALSLPSGVPANFFYQTTDPVTNLPTGTANAPVNILAGRAQTYYFQITPTQAFTRDIALNFSCSNAPQPTAISGVNTFLLTAEATPLPDILSVSETPTHDGNILLNAGGTGVMAAAGINISAPGTITFTPTDTAYGQVVANLPVTLTICQTSPQGVCVNPPEPAASVTSTLGNGDVATFTVFVQATGPIPYDPAKNRVFLIATSNGKVVGQTSAAIQMP